MVLPLKIHPDKILRTPGQPVKFPLAAPVKKMVKDMFDTVRDSNGIGLAAPQIGKSLRVIVINLEHLNLPAFALINPEVTKFYKSKSSMEEGCLSIPGV